MLSFFCHWQLKPPCGDIRFKLRGQLQDGVHLARPSCKVHYEDSPGTRREHSLDRCCRDVLAISVRHGEDRDIHIERVEEIASILRQQIEQFDTSVASTSTGVGGEGGGENGAMGQVSGARSDGPSIFTVWHWWRSRLSSARGL